MPRHDSSRFRLVGRNLLSDGSPALRGGEGAETERADLCRVTGGKIRFGHPGGGHCIVVNVVNVFRRDDKGKVIIVPVAFSTIPVFSEGGVLVEIWRKFYALKCVNLLQAWIIR